MLQRATEHIVNISGCTGSMPNKGSTYNDHNNRLSVYSMR